MRPCPIPAILTLGDRKVIVLIRTAVYSKTGQHMAIMGNVMKWDPELEVGIEIIDNQHKILFDLGNDLINAVNTGTNMRIIDILFSVMTSYAYRHFETEEELLAKNGNSNVDDHCQEHYKLLKQLHDYKVEYNNGRQGDVNLPDFLKNWLTDHIKNSDKKVFTGASVGALQNVPEVDSVDGFDDKDIERRDHKRLRSDSILPEDLVGHCYNATKSRNGSMVVMDFSSGGMKIFSDHEHDVDDLLILSCNIGPKQKIKEKVRVRNIHNDMYGVEFISPEAETVTFLGALCGEELN